ncbi:hypothetical protein PTNB73_03976 [Pyrenophora teres f. teres]|nr:hypothetical protein PTNB85_05351 [Pyrenophora teres f. teres]KAE8839563.1 hypothetical protein HRS9122_06168 [Pyrenophora teres f. teres]KAE8868923.1 hypothetical protein PTNB73_03976 [Pyrenophora teres f. teres]
MLGTYRRQKRPVTACQPCYQKKQRCDRQVPCSNCARRQQPKLCQYAAETLRQSPNKAGSLNAFEKCRSYGQPVDCNYSPIQPSQAPRQNAINDKYHLQPMEQLLDKFGLSPSIELENNEIPSSLVSALQDCFNAYPKRSITDILVQSFFENIKLLDQDLDQVLFSKTYKDWWNEAPVQGLERVLFGILLLRVCCIGLAFLQPGTPRNKEITVIGTSKVATHCDKLASRIQALIQGLLGNKSCIYVHIIHLDALYHTIKGQLETAWYTLSSAVRIVQYMGVNVNSQRSQRKEEFRCEVQAPHFIFLNVLIMDAVLCFFLDRPPTVSKKRFIELQSAGVVHQILPSHESEPGSYDERILQAKLWQLWTAMKEEVETPSNSDSIPAQVEQRYQRLRKSFIDQLPKAFSLVHPDKQWDQRNPMLKYQRNLLHANILMVQCGILQDSLLLGHTDIVEMSQSEKSLTHQHIRLLASSASTLRGVLCCIYSLSGPTKGAISILRPFAIRSAILAGLSFMIIRSMDASNTSSRSWPDYHSEDTISLEACKSHIQDTLTLLTASQGVPSAENEMRSLQAILGRIEELGTINANASVSREETSQQQFYEQSLISGTMTSPDFSLASADLLDGMPTSIASPSMNGFPGFRNDDVWISNYLSTLLDEAGSSKPMQGGAMALNLDRSTPFSMPMFDTSTSNSTPSTRDHHWENNIGSIDRETNCEGLLNDNANLFI